MGPFRIIKVRSVKNSEYELNCNEYDLDCGLWANLTFNGTEHNLKYGLTQHWGFYAAKIMVQVVFCQSEHKFKSKIRD